MAVMVGWVGRGKHTKRVWRTVQILAIDHVAIVVTRTTRGSRKRLKGEKKNNTPYELFRSRVTYNFRGRIGAVRIMCTSGRRDPVFGPTGCQSAMGSPPRENNKTIIINLFS